VSETGPVEELLAANRSYVEGHPPAGPAEPSRALAVVTCMDARIDVFAALGLSLGEAHVIRNAGGRMTDDVARSLALSSHVLGVRTVVLMQHTGCGLAGVTDEELRALTGSSIGFLPIGDHRAALSEDIERLAGITWLKKVELVAGLLYDVESGAVSELIRWSRP